MNETELASIAIITNSAKPLIQRGADFLESLLGEPMKIAGGMIGDQIYAWRIMRAAKLAADCQDVLDRRGIQAQQLPAGFLIPFLDSALNSDGSLDELWANLLASAIESDKCRHPAYRDILSKMTSDEAKIVKWLYERKPLPVVWFTKTFPQVFWTRPEPLSLSSDNMVTLSFANLGRLGLMAAEGGLRSPMPTEFDGMLDDPQVKSVERRFSSDVKSRQLMQARLTDIGFELADACMSRETTSEV